MLNNILHFCNLFNQKQINRDKEESYEELNIDKNTEENFNTLMENGDGSKKSVDGMGAIEEAAIWTPRS